MRSEGENLADPESSLSCVEVFGLGGRTETDDAAKRGYYVVRGIFATSVTEAARFITERGIVEEGSPVLVRFGLWREPVLLIAGVNYPRAVVAQART